jgi:hypothetical protein
MRKRSTPSLTACLFLCSLSAWAQTNPCDINGDGTVNSADVQAAINMSIGIATCPSTVSVAGPGVCNAVVVQRVVNASLGQSCLTSTGNHVVSLSWTASTSSGVTGYQISRGTSSTGPFTVLGSVTGAATTSYMDTTVVSGSTYYYVIAAVAGSTVGPNSSPIATVPSQVPTP